MGDLDGASEEGGDESVEQSDGPLHLFNDYNDAETTIEILQGMAEDRVEGPSLALSERQTDRQTEKEGRVRRTRRGEEGERDGEGGEGTTGSIPQKYLS
jgi:hypothetical protein